MKKILILFLLIIINNFTLLSQNQTTKYKLKIIDTQTKEPLPFATILINGNSHRGVVTNLNGLAELSLSPTDECIQISYVGYETRKIEKEQITTTIALKPLEVKLKEVVIFPGKNPAHRIIKKAVENRKINNPDDISEYACNIYNKSIYNYIFEGKAKESETYKELRELSDTSHLIIMESATTRYYKAPDKINEIIKKVRVSGLKEPSIAPLSTDLQPFHFYNPTIDMLEITYLNPISPGSWNRYLFLLEDTLFHKKDTTYIITFEPKKNTNFEGLKGFLHINTNQYAIEKVVASPAEKKLMQLHVQQNYEYKNNYWFPKELKSEFRWENIYNIGLGMNVKSESYITNFRTDIPKDSVKYNEEILQFDKQSTKDADLAMKKYRYIDLNKKEENTYLTIDSIGKAINMDYWLKFSEKISAYKLPISKFYIPLEKIMTFNEFEGYRFGLGLYTDDKLITWMEAGGWGAYGFRDKEWKYGGDIKFFFDKDQEHVLSWSYQHNAVFPGNEDFARAKTYIEGYFLQQADYTNQIKASFQTRIRYLQLKLNFMHDERSPQYNYSFLLDNNPVSNYEVTELGAQIRFSFKEKYIWQLKQKIRIETNWPVLSVGYKKGIKGLYGGEIDYEKLWAQIDYSHHFPRLGKSNIRLEVGKIWGDVPYSFLFSGAGGWSSSMPFFVENRFNTMTPNQFANNEIMNAYFSHDFGARLFSTSNWKPKIMITQAFGMGNLINKNLHQDIDLVDMNKGYYESGLVINDIIRVNIVNFVYLGLGGGAFYNYGHYSSSDWIENFKLKINLKVSF
ncbi:MAG: DUF5686 family protein [Bacteroidota bacterium]|nr:DUF5686 family protein [Bacteroidota bacterium]